MFVQTGQNPQEHRRCGTKGFQGVQKEVAAVGRGAEVGGQCHRDGGFTGGRQRNVGDQGSLQGEHSYSCILCWLYSYSYAR